MFSEHIIQIDTFAKAALALASLLIAVLLAIEITNMLRFLVTLMVLTSFKEASPDGIDQF
jgi:hypothetical protein